MKHHPRYNENVRTKSGAAGRRNRGDTEPRIDLPRTHMWIPRPLRLMSRCGGLVIRRTPSILIYIPKACFDYESVMLSLLVISFGSSLIVPFGCSFVVHSWERIEMRWLIDFSYLDFGSWTRLLTMDLGALAWVGVLPSAALSHLLTSIVRLLLPYVSL